MVIVRLHGGLGNQLFQYALARNLNLLNKIDVKLDISSYDKDNLRGYLLDELDTRLELCSENEVKKILYRPRYEDMSGETRGKCLRIFLNGMERLKPYHRRRTIQQRKFQFDPDVLRIKGPAFIDGHWQSEKYFFSNVSTIKQELSSIKRPNIILGPILKKIESENSVCVHIRRGDYVSDASKREYFGLCSLDYYKRGIKTLLKINDKKSIYLFSDDKKLLESKPDIGCDYLCPALLYGRNEIDEFSLMLKCKEYVLANSTFGWWAAWLSDSKAKRVVVPERWFKNTQHNTSDLIPDSWEILATA